MGAADKYVTAAGVVGAAVAFFNPEIAYWLPKIADWLPSELPEISRWWALAPLLLLVVYGFLRALQERFEGLEEKLETAQKRKAVKNLLGDAVEQGEDLRPVTRQVGGEWGFTDQRDVEDWVHRTHDLIEAAFDKGEARRFLDSSDYTPENPVPYREIRVDPYKYYLEPRLRRLSELIVRANGLEVSPDFDPQSFTQSVEESTAARLRLEAAVKRISAENEELKADREQLTAESEAFREESQRLSGELEGLLRRRCRELSDELDDFFAETRSEDPDATIHLYRERYGDKVDLLRVELEKHGLWKPREEVRGKLEYPQTPDDLRSLYSYLRNIGVGVDF
jgi:hypothetical protein